MSTGGFLLIIISNMHFYWWVYAYIYSDTALPGPSWGSVIVTPDGCCPSARWPATSAPSSATTTTSGARPGPSRGSAGTIQSTWTYTAPRELSHITFFHHRVLQILHYLANDNNLKYIESHFSVSLPPQCWSQAIMCFSTPRMYPQSRCFLVLL